MPCGNIFVSTVTKKLNKTIKTMGQLLRISRYGAWVLTLLIITQLSMAKDTEKTNHKTQKTSNLALNYLDTHTKGKAITTPSVYIEEGVENPESFAQLQNQEIFTLVTHGKPGYLLIDQEWKDAEGIVRFLQTQNLQTYKQLNILGCEFARGAVGKAAVAYIQDQLDIDVAASDDITGVGGDWTLEIGSVVLPQNLHSYAASLQCAGAVGGVLPTDDFDGDGICNADDYDDDNDGIPDYYETDVNGGSCSSSPSFIAPTAVGCYNPNGYTLSASELNKITDVNSITEYQASNAGLPTINQINLSYEGVTVSEIRIYNFLNTQVGDVTKRHVERINNIRLYDANNLLLYAASGPIYPTTITAGTYYAIPIPGGIEGVARLEVSGLVSAPAGFGLRDILLIGCEQDFDGDGYPNKFDTDSDNYGCPDAVESNAKGPNTGYTLAELNDKWMVDLPVGTNPGSNSYGVPGADRNNPVGAFDSTVTMPECDACNPQSTAYTDVDGDGVADACDLDSDNDGITNNTECPGINVYSTDTLTYLDLSNGYIETDSSVGDWIGPSYYAQNAATTTDGTCLDVRIRVEQLTKSQPEQFKWSNNVGTTKLFLGGANRDYEFTVEFYECGTTTPVPLSVVYKVRDIDGDGDWNGDKILDDPRCDQNIFGANDDYVYCGVGELEDYFLEDPTLIYAPEKGTNQYFFSSGNDNSNYSGITSIPYTKGAATVYLRFKKKPSFKYTYHTGGFGGIYKDFGFVELIYCDTDADGIPDYLDLDSDNDGCPDATEGDGGFHYEELVNDTLTGGVDANGVPIVAAGGQGYGSSKDTTLFGCLQTVPDINGGFVGIPIKGDVSTNDDVPDGSTYGGVVTTPDGVTNPSTDMPVVNPDGTYEFNTDVPGVYQFWVEVCAPGITSPCPLELLTITVVDPYEPDNTPIANTDRSSTMEGTPVSINILDNDIVGNTNGAFGLPTVVDSPSNGSVVIDANGVATYIPNPGFTGVDTFYYEVCDTVPSPPKCAEAMTIIEVLPTGTNGLTTVDDFTCTTENDTATGNALSNDVDPNGDPMTVTAVTTPTAVEGGNYTIDANGDFTFIPDSGFVGSTNFEYEVCDNQGLCESATVYVVVIPNNETFPDINVGYTDGPLTGDVSTNDQVTPGTTYGNLVPATGSNNPNTNTPVLNEDGTYTFVTSDVGVYMFDVEVCSVSPCTGDTKCQLEVLAITIVDSTENALIPPVANIDKQCTNEDVPATVNILSNDAAMMPGGVLGNVTIVTPPNNGTATIDGDNNAIYTPNSGFIGEDTFYYEVCDIQIGICVQSMVIVCVTPADENGISAADDYNYGYVNDTLTGNVVENDTDPEGGALSVTPGSETKPGVGTFTVDAAGNYTFTPNPDYHGSTNFTYEVCDTLGLCTEATVYIVILPWDPEAAPIRIDKFNLISKNCSVTINWTYAECENSTLEVEQSVNYGAFETVSQHTCDDNSLEYSYNTGTIKSDDILGYRLKAVDEFGKYTYSEIAYTTVNCNDLTHVTVYPNPATDEVKVAISNIDDKNLSYVVYDAVGRVVLSGKWDSNTISQVNTIDISTLIEGHYSIEVEHSGKRSSFKILKK